MSEAIGECDYIFTLDPMKTSEAGVECKMECLGCGVKIQFDVIARRTDEDIKEWITRVQEYAGSVHTKVASTCSSITCDLQIPMPTVEGQGIGEVVRQ